MVRLVLHPDRDPPSLIAWSEGGGVCLAGYDAGRPGSRRRTQGGVIDALNAHGVSVSTSFSLTMSGTVNGNRKLTPSPIGLGGCAVQDFYSSRGSASGGSRGSSPGRWWPTPPRPGRRLAAWRAVWGAQGASPVYGARYRHLTSREHNKLRPTQAQTVIAAAILRHLHAVITPGQAWDPTIAARGTRPSIQPAAAA